MACQGGTRRDREGTQARAWFAGYGKRGRGPGGPGIENQRTSKQRTSEKIKEHQRTNKNPTKKPKFEHLSSLFPLLFGESLPSSSRTQRKAVCRRQFRGSFARCSFVDGPADPGSVTGFSSIFSLVLWISYLSFRSGSKPCRFWNEGSDVVQSLALDVESDINMYREIIYQREREYGVLAPTAAE